MLVERILSIGLTLGLSVLTSAGLSPWSTAQGAYPAWVAHAGHAKRPQFRPWSRTHASAVVSRWRPHTAAGARAASPTPFSRSPVTPHRDAAAAALVVVERTQPRKAGPTSRAQELGVRFRPDGQGSAQGLLLPPDDGLQDGYRSRLQSQFRPARVKRKRTYEQLQGQRVAYQPPGGRTPYPVLPTPPLGAYGGYWPAW
jgi:hypothetical protein